MHYRTTPGASCTKCWVIVLLTYSQNSIHNHFWVYQSMRTFVSAHFLFIHHHLTWNWAQLHVPLGTPCLLPLLTMQIGINSYHLLIQEIHVSFFWGTFAKVLLEYLCVFPSGIVDTFHPFTYFIIGGQSSCSGSRLIRVCQGQQHHSVIRFQRIINITDGKNSF